MHIRDGHGNGDWNKAPNREREGVQKPADGNGNEPQSTSLAEYLSRVYDINIMQFLARQNISFHGHGETDSLNHGNFLELVHFMAKYNPMLNCWLDCHPRNVSRLSHNIQNQLLAVDVIVQIAAECCGQLIIVTCDEVSD